MPVSLACFAVALVSATTVAGYATAGAVSAPAWHRLAPYETRFLFAEKHAEEVDAAAAKLVVQPEATPVAIFPGRIGPSFRLDSKDATAIDLHAASHHETSPQTETWLFQWTPE